MCSPDFRDLLTNQTLFLDLGTSNQERSVRIISKISNRLESFLLFIADKLEGHELLQEFLHAEDLNREAITARAILKGSFYEDMLITSHPSTVRDLPMTLVRFDTKSKETEGLMLAERKFGDFLRRIAKEQITLYNRVAELAFILNNPTTLFFNIHVEPHFTALSKTIKQLATGELALSQKLLDQNYSLAAGLEGISYFQVLASEFVALERHAQSLHDDLKRLAKRAASPSAKQLDLVGDVDQAYTAYSSVTDQLKKKGCKVNSVASSLNTDLSLLEDQHCDLLTNVLDGHAQINIAALESTLNVLSSLELSIY